MTLISVQKAVRKARKEMKVWDRVADAYWPGENSWREDQTRYAFIDPIIKALGWDTSDPQKCYPRVPQAVRGTAS